MEIQVANPTVLWPTIALVTAATVSDLRSRRIPNRLVAPFLVLGLVASAVAHGWSGVWQSLLGVLLAAGIQGVPCYLGWMGMGDLKLCAAIGAWIGPSQLIVALVMTALAGGILGVVWAAAGGFLLEAFLGAAGLMFRRRKRMTLDNPAARTMPYAPAIALGTICSFLGRSI
jgi:prepilin peptidase CpaA